jgi:hypothetical protein
MHTIINTPMGVWVTVAGIIHIIPCPVRLPSQQEQVGTIAPTERTDHSFETLFNIYGPLLGFKTTVIKESLLWAQACCLISD